MSEENKTPLFFKGSIKMLRESLCLAQHEILTWHPDKYNVADDIAKLIDEIDRHRPLGLDGKHGDRHTQFCGCEDKPGWDKDLGDVSRFYVEIPMTSSDGGPVQVLTKAGCSMYESLSRSLAAFRNKRNELLLQTDDDVPDRQSRLHRTEKTIEEYERLLCILIRPIAL